MKVVATGTKKSTEEDKARIRELMGDDVKMLDEGNPRALLRTVEKYRADILIAGGRNMYTALKGRIPSSTSTGNANSAMPATTACGNCAPAVPDPREPGVAGGAPAGAVGAARVGRARTLANA